MSSTSILSANRLQQTFLFKDDKMAGPLRFIHGDDGKSLQIVSRSLQMSVQPNAKDYLLYTTGLGLSVKDIPLRLPAVMVPTLRVMERLKELGIIPPTYLVYQATDFITETNDLHPKTGRARSTLMRKYLEKYIRILHPTIQDDVVFKFGAEACVSADVIRCMSDRIRQKLRESENLQDIFHKLSTYRSSQAKPEGSELIYAAANAVFSGADRGLYPFQDMARHRMIVPIGGKQEKPFFQITKMMQSEETVLPMLQRSGERPTYYPNQDGDLVYENHDRVLSELPPAIRYDFEVLAADGASIGVLSDIFKETL